MTREHGMGNSMADVASTLDYWRARLDGVQPVELPADRPRPLTGTDAVESIPFGASADALRTLADRYGTSMLVVGLAAYVVVLSRWSRQDDISLATSGTVLRADLAGDLPFTELMAQLKAA